MSLDFYLRTKQKKRKYVGTGVFVRENGETFELETTEEVMERFPDVEIRGIKEYMFETEDMFSRNITHNLGEMAGHVPCDGGKSTLYGLLWRPKEHGFDVVTEHYRACVAECLSYMLTNRMKLEKLNPGNGWGSFDGLLKFVYELAIALSRWDGEEEVEIYADR